MGLFLNKRKSVIARQGQQQVITGVVVNEGLHAPSDYKRRLRQEMHYCMTRGILAHTEAIGAKQTPEEYRRILLGRVNHILSIEPDNQPMLTYRAWLRSQSLPK